MACRRCGMARVSSPPARSAAANPPGESTPTVDASQRSLSSQSSTSQDGPTDPVPAKIVVDPAVDEVIRSLETKTADKAEEMRLAKFELELRLQLASGRKIWGEELTQTEEEIRKMPTRELGLRLWATGLHAREFMTFDHPNYAMKRMEVFYKGWAELFQRPNVWEAMIGGIETLSSQLDTTKSDRENLEFAMALMTLPETYGYPPIRRSLIGHEKELIQAHVAALLKIKEFVLAVSGRGTSRTAALMTPRTAIILSQTAVALGKSLSPALALSARESLSQFPWSEGYTSEDIPRYVDQAVLKLRGIID
jgi:hypothetical protein